MKTRTRLLTALLALVWTASLTGCTSPRLIDPNMTTQRVIKAVPFTPPSDGYFVPDSRMRQILDLLTEKDVFGK